MDIAGEPEVRDCAYSYADCAGVIIMGFLHYTLQKDVEHCGGREAALTDIEWCAEPLSHCALNKYCNDGFCVDFLDDLDQFLLYVVLLHSVPIASRHTLSKAFLKYMKPWWMSRLYFSHKREGWIFVRLYLFYSEKQHVLQQWSLLPVVSTCSASLYLHDWWYWWYDHSVIVVGSLSLEW